MIEPWMQPDLSIMTDDEIQRVIISIIEATDDAVDETEIKKAVDWAARAKLGGMLYDMIQSGDVAIAGFESPENPLITVRTEVLSKVREAFKAVFGDELD